MSDVQSISCVELKRLSDAGDIDLIDVRTPAEFREMHASIAKNVPLESFNPNEYLSRRDGSSNEPIYVICRSGNRGKQACGKFAQAGFTQVFNVEGGTLAWEQAGYPVERGKKTISLERQVRIVAGMMVFVGSLLALFIHPYWAALPAFVGAGLTFAGITDTCGMAMFLARMPWNQVGPSCSTKTPTGQCSA